MGVCEKDSCGGYNGGKGNQVDSGVGTQRVTICHRTCSTTNPWVRITIDDDAWDGEDASGKCLRKACPGGFVCFVAVRPRFSRDAVL